MELDLNFLLEEIHTWKNIVKTKDEKIENLQVQITECKQHIESIDNSNSALLQEIAHQSRIVSSLYQSLAIVEKTETDNKALVEEIKKLKYNIKEQKDLHRNENTEHKKILVKLKEEHQVETERKIADFEKNISSELEKCAIELREKENCIFILKDEVSKLEYEKNQEILKMQIECEEKLGRMKNKFSKNKKTHHHDFKSNDFFRQKYMEKEKEAKEESIKLKKEIDDLRREISILKSNDVLRVTTPLDDSMQTKQISFSSKTDYSYEEYSSSKRAKTNSNNPQSDGTNISNYVDRSQDDFAMCNFISSNMKKQTTNTATPFKKKLFNLDMNYFTK